MDIGTYQIEACQTNLYGLSMEGLYAQIMGLCGESGEVADKMKKIIRDNNAQITSEDRTEIAKELGDVLWYLSQVAESLHLNLNVIANENLEKLQKRQQEGKLQGSGDNR